MKARSFGEPVKEELKQILEEHKIWVESRGKRGKRANLQGANLDSVRLYGANLYGANLQGAILEYADLEGANLKGANLKDVYLEGAYLEGAYLQGAKFSIEIRKCFSFVFAFVSKEQLPWLALHPKFAKFLPTLQIK